MFELTGKTQQQHHNFNLDSKNQPWCTLQLKTVKTYFSLERQELKPFAVSIKNIFKALLVEHVKKQEGFIALLQENCITTNKLLTLILKKKLC